MPRRPDRAFEWRVHSWLFERMPYDHMLAYRWSQQRGESPSINFNTSLFVYLFGVGVSFLFIGASFSFGQHENILQNLIVARIIRPC